MKPDDLRLLSSYRGGPRIWDAAELFEQVLRLADDGLLTPVEGRIFGPYRLTARGCECLTEAGYPPAPAGRESATGAGEARGGESR